MVTYKYHLAALSIAAFTMACQNIPTPLDVKNSQIKDRVIACSGGFSQDTQIALQGLVDLTNNPLANSKGELSLDYKQQAKSIIFQELDSKDRLQAYQDYLKCIETNWNTPMQAQALLSKNNRLKETKCHRNHDQSTTTKTESTK